MEAYAYTMKIYGTPGPCCAYDLGRLEAMLEHGSVAIEQHDPPEMAARFDEDEFGGPRYALVIHRLADGGYLHVLERNHEGHRTAMDQTIEPVYEPEEVDAKTESLLWWLEELRELEPGMVRALAA